MAEAGRRAPRSLLPALRLAKLPPGTAVFARDWYGLPVAALMGLVAALIYVRAFDHLRPVFDDSYITLTFARNLAEHGKLSFDGETWSTGATSVLHVVVLAVPIKLGAAPIFTAIAVGVASHALLAVAVYLLACAILRRRLAALLGAAAIAFTPYAAFDAGSGLETSLFLALVTGTMAAYFLARSSKGKAVTGLLLFLTVLTRPEGAFLLAAILVYHWLVRDRDEPLSVYLKDALLLALPAVIAIAGLALLSLAVNGSLGGTASAKLRFFQEDEQSLQDRIWIGTDGIGLFVGPVITLIGVAALAGRRREALLFVLFWLPVVVAYVLLFPGGLQHYFFRYQHPVLPLIAVLAGGGAAYLVSVALSSGAAVRLIAVAALIIAIVPFWQQYERYRLVYRAAAFETLVDLEAMALDLNRIVAPDEVLATHDIGAVGFFADYEVLDLVGLVNPDILPYHEERRLREYVEEMRPDYLLIFPGWDAFFLHIFPGETPERYELVKVYPGRDIREFSYFLYRVTYP